MTRGQYLAKLAKFALIVGVPIAVVGFVSSAKASKDKIRRDAAAKLRDASEVPASLVEIPLDDQSETVAWYSYAGRWIRIDEYPAYAEVSIDPISALTPAPPTSGVTDRVVYRGRFRWSVMLESSGTAGALASEIVYETGEATRAITYADAGELTGEARDAAIGVAAKRAAAWIVMATGYEGAA